MCAQWEEQLRLFAKCRKPTAVFIPLFYESHSTGVAGRKVLIVFAVDFRRAAVEHLPRNSREIERQA